MYSKKILNICVITLMSNLIVVNGFASNITANLNTNVSNNIKNNIKKNDNKQVKDNNKKDGIIATIKKSFKEEIEKDTARRAKTYEHIASYLSANLPKQLIKCMENALKNNKQIQEAQKEILVNNEEHNINRAALMPVITAENSTGTNNDYLKKPEIAVKNLQQYEYDKINRTENTTVLRVKYNIFHGGADIANLKSVDKSIEAKWKNYDSIIQKVLNETAQNYFTIVAKQEEVKNAKALLEARKESYRVAQEMLKAGTAKELDVAQADAGCYDAQSRLYTAEVEEQLYRIALKQLTGVDVTEKLDAPDKLFDKKFTIKEALDVAIKNNPQIIAATAEHAAAKAKLSVPNGEFAPSIDIVASGSRKFTSSKQYAIDDHINSKNNSSNTIYEPGVALQVSLPIFNGGSSFAKKVQYAYNVSKVAVTKDKIYKEIEKEIATSIEKLDAAENTIVFATKMIDAQNTVLESTKKEQAAGTKITKDVLDAQLEVFKAQTMLTNAIKDRYIQQCNIMALLGWFNPSDLKLKGLTFNYKQEYYKQIRRIIPTFEGMGVETKKTSVINNKQKKVYNNKNNPNNKSVSDTAKAKMKTTR